jgi:hypothetical protein
MPSLIQLELDIDTISTRVDRSVKVTASTARELTDEAGARLFALRGRTVWAAFADAELNVEDIKVPDLIPGHKTQSQSQRLRAVIYRIWEQKQEGDFEKFYADFMEKIIDYYKGKLE